MAEDIFREERTDQLITVDVDKAMSVLLKAGLATDTSYQVALMVNAFVPQLIGLASQMQEERKDVHQFLLRNYEATKQAKYEQRIAEDCMCFTTRSEIMSVAQREASAELADLLMQFREDDAKRLHEVLKVAASMLQAFLMVSGERRLKGHDIVRKLLPMNVLQKIVEDED